MSRALSTSDRETWLRTLSFLLLGSVCYALPWRVFAALPVPVDNTPALQIQGSNTIGAKLGPALVQGLFEQQGLRNIRIEPAAAENEQRVLAEDQNGRPLSISVAAHGSGTGFTSLLDGTAELAASSRPIKDGEAAALAGELFDHVGSGRIKIEINQHYALQDAVQAHRDLESRKTTGSSIFVI